jgi:hypothetical protein
MSVLQKVSKMSAEEQMAMLYSLESYASEEIQKAIDNSSQEPTFEEINRTRSEPIERSIDFVITGLKKIKSDIDGNFSQLNDGIQSKLNSISNGKDGKDGKNGVNGKDGAIGKDGKDGRDGKDGKNGKDGTSGRSIEDAYVALDGELVLKYSDGKEVSVGEVKGERGERGFQGPPGISTSSSSSSSQTFDFGTFNNSFTDQSVFLLSLTTVNMGSFASPATFSISGGTF